jgi:hypothetical protein
MKKIKVVYFVDDKWTCSSFKWLIKDKSIEVSLIKVLNWISDCKIYEKQILN